MPGKYILGSVGQKMIFGAKIRVLGAETRQGPFRVFCGSQPQIILLWLGQGLICFIVMSTHQIMTGKCILRLLGGSGGQNDIFGGKPGPLDGVLREPGFFSFFSFMF